MFCSVKRDKKNQTYRFYLCSRYRDKETGKMKCSDKYIMSLQKDKLLTLSDYDMNQSIENILINKGISLENKDLLIAKINDVVANDKDTTVNDDVVIKTNNTTDEKTEVVTAEIVEDCEIDYSTMITFDVRQDYSRNIKSSLNFNFMAKTFGEHIKDNFEIEKEEIEKIYDKVNTIDNRILEIISEYNDIQKINDEFIALKSDIRVIQDIYISCYSKVPTSEIWLVGCGYIERIYELEYLIMPYGGMGLFEEWESIKYEENLDDSKVYMNREKYFEEIELYRSSSLEINKDDITGSLVRLMLYSSYETDYTSAGYIDISVNNQSTSLSIEHFIDWINNKPIKDYKVDIDNLKRYQEQLYKYKNVRSKTRN